MADELNAVKKEFGLFDIGIGIYYSIVSFHSVVNKGKPQCNCSDEGNCKLNHLLLHLLF